MSFLDPRLGLKEPATQKCQQEQIKNPQQKPVSLAKGLGQGQPNDRKLLVTTYSSTEKNCGPLPPTPAKGVGVQAITRGLTSTGVVSAKATGSWFFHPHLTKGSRPHGVNRDDTGT